MANTRLPSSTSYFESVLGGVLHVQGVAQVHEPQPHLRGFFAGASGVVQPASAAPTARIVNVFKFIYVSLSFYVALKPLFQNA